MSNIEIMQYTVRKVPKEIDRALRKLAKSEGKSLNDLAVEGLALRAGVSLNGKRKPKRDLSFLVGSMDEDTRKAIAEVREESERIWPEEWR